MEITAMVGIGLLVRDKFPQLLQREHSWFKEMAFLLIALVMCGIGVIQTGALVDSLCRRSRSRHTTST
jgi:uncharacterized membrane protein YczE